MNSRISFSSSTSRIFCSEVFIRLRKIKCKDK
jgi:hypothetical protein